MSTDFFQSHTFPMLLHLCLSNYF